MRLIFEGVMPGLSLVWNLTEGVVFPQDQLLSQAVSLGVEAVARPRGAHHLDQDGSAGRQWFKTLL